jgi:hypothetical protein
MERSNWYPKTLGNSQGLIIEENTGKSIAVVYDIKDTNLIASSRELLKACEMVVRYVDEGIRVESEYSEMCRSAIEKARNNN